MLRGTNTNVIAVFREGAVRWVSPRPRGEKPVLWRNCNGLILYKLLLRNALRRFWPFLFGLSFNF